MRILLLTSRLSPAAGGLAVSVPGLAHSIDPLPGMEMHVMGTLDPADPGAAERWGPRVQGFDVKGPGALHYAPKMQRAIQTMRPDLIDMQGLWTYPSLASLRYTRRRQNFPYIVTPRGMLDPWARRNSAWKKALAGAAFERAHLRGATILRATAELEAQHFRDMGLTNPIAIVPNGIDLPVLEERQTPALRQMLFLSRIHPKKGVDILLKSWAQLADRHVGWELVIAGIDENGHEAELKQLALDLGVPRTRFIGERHGTEKQQLYRDADLFVLPTHAENFGLVVAEALAQETPVITTRNAPWPGLETERCGWWIDLDQHRLTETMRAALARPSAELAQMGRRGRRWVERDYMMTQVADRMREVYLWAGKQGPKPESIHD